MSNKSQIRRNTFDKLLIAKSFFIIATLFCLLCFLYCILLVYGFTSGFGTDKIEGEVGDLIGGLSSPIIGLIAAVLTFLAFWIQYSFNVSQTKSIKRQRKDSKMDRFESLFYQMIQIHRDNVSDTNIKDKSNGRRAFISMFKEFKFCHYILAESYKDFLVKHPQSILDHEQLLNISYLTFYFGIGESSETLVSSLLEDYDPEFLEMYFEKIKARQKEWINIKIGNEDLRRSNLLSSLKELKLSINFEGKDYEFSTGYKPFSGHLARLGHYYRHLYQIFEFVERENPKNKAEYVRIARAQISAHEQLLLYYSSLTPLGRSWWENDYIQKFKLVKNIPLPLASIEPIPIKKLAATYFEWNKIDPPSTKQISIS